MTDDELKAIEARAMAATRGPWELGEAGNCNVVRYDGEDVTGIANAHWSNADFIAAARADVPALVAEVRRLRGLIKLGEHREQYCDWCGAFRKPSASDKDPHAADCPAFTPSGDVR